MAYPYIPTEKYDVHTHTTLSPNTYEALEKFTKYENFVRIRNHPEIPCCAQMMQAKRDKNGNIVEENVRAIEENTYDGAARILDCDKHGVTVQVLSPTPMNIPDYIDDPRDASEICKILNDDNASLVAKYPERFQALGAIPMRHPKEAIKEMERIKNNGMRGIEINSNINGLDLDTPAFFEVFEAAQDMDMAVFVHPWGGFMFPQEPELQKRMNPNRNWRPWLIGMPGVETPTAFDSMRAGGVHERLPNLRVLYAHGMGAAPTLFGRLEHGQYCRPDLFNEASSLNTWDTIEKCGVYADSLTHNPWALKTLIDILGSKRIAVGSDYPYPLGEIDPFDPETRKDPKGNACPYDYTKNIYPGHMIEHLPNSPENVQRAYQYFNQLSRSNSDGPRDLPILTDEQKQNIFANTAKEWLGLG